jgi:hypothetical protein
MPRGLSELQKAILRLAYRNRQEREEWSVDLFHAEVLHEHFGWPIARHRRWRPEVGERPLPMDRYFSMREIGEARYRKTQASLSRAVSRLERRGLVERFHAAGWTGYGCAVLDLTDEGVRVAEHLLVNTPGAVTES